MSTILAPLPATDTPLFQALLTELPDAVASALGAEASALGPLLESAPYLLDLARAHGSPRPWTRDRTAPSALS